MEGRRMSVQTVKTETPTLLNAWMTLALVPVAIFGFWRGGALNTFPLDASTVRILASLLLIPCAFSAWFATAALRERTTAWIAIAINAALAGFLLCALVLAPLPR